MNYQVGNYISTEHGELPIKHIVFDQYQVTGKDGRVLWANKVEPIILTEEWLIKLGFEFDNESKSWSILTSIDDFDYLFEIQKFNDFFEPYFLRTKIKCVHLLQNIYFSLTNKELICQ